MTAFHGTNAKLIINGQEHKLKNISTMTIKEVETETNKIVNDYFYDKPKTIECTMGPVKWANNKYAKRLKHYLFFGYWPNKSGTLNLKQFIKRLRK